MPEPGSHKYDIKRARRRSAYEDKGVPDQRADEAANADLQRDFPPRRPDDEYAAGPFGERPPEGPPGAQGRQRDAEGGGIRLRSSTFADHDMLPRRCSRDGENSSPALEWDAVPENAVELAVICEDPDAPGGTFLHWMVANVPPTVTAIADGEVPRDAVECRNSFGNIGWDGPQPPVGDEPHRYFFRVYASSRPLGLSADSTPDDLRNALRGAEVGRGNIVGLYQR